MKNFKLKIPIKSEKVRLDKSVRVDSKNASILFGGINTRSSGKERLNTKGLDL